MENIRSPELVTTEDEVLLKEIVSCTSELGLGGKFEGTVVVSGKDGVSSYQHKGDSALYMAEGVYANSDEHFGRLLKNDPTGLLPYFKMYWKEHAYRQSDKLSSIKVPDGIDINTSLSLVYIQDIQNTRTAKLLIEIPVSKVSWDNREVFLTDAICTLPTERLHELLALIRKNPANAERFIQLTFGFNEDTGNPGIDSFSSRKPVKNVLLIDAEKYLPSQRPYVKDGKVNFSLEYKITKTDYHGDTVETIPYLSKLPQFNVS